MSRASLVLLVAVAVLFNMAASQECPPNQEWSTCGTACPPACNKLPNQPCTMQCVIGCQCKQGFLLNPAGECVSPQNC